MKLTLVFNLRACKKITSVHTIPKFLSQSTEVEMNSVNNNECNISVHSVRFDLKQLTSPTFAISHRFLIKITTMSELKKRDNQKCMENTEFSAIKC